MIRIAHLSDPHFGTEHPHLVPYLLQALAALAPDVIVLSGDLTQRARRHQFAAAQSFIAACPAPVLCIPGNHDIPLENLFARLLHPFRAYHRAIGPDLAPVIDTPAAIIAGVNTANPHVWKDGRITPAQLDRLARVFAHAGPRQRIVALHHPPVPPQGEPSSLAGASEAITAFATMGVDLVLSGHLHFSHAAPLASAPRILAVQAGTCLSNRTRQDGNAFTQIDLAPDSAVLTHHRAQTDGRFVPDAAMTFTRSAQGWA